MGLFKPKNKHMGPEADMKEGKPSLAIAFSTQQHGKKKKKYADGGEVAADEPKELSDADKAIRDGGKKYMNQEEQDAAMRNGEPLSSLYNPKKMADGGEVMPADFMEEDERAESIAEAIMQKRRKFAEGGVVDLEANSEEQPNEYDELNAEAGGAEQYDDSQLSAQPEDSNEMGDSIDADEHDMVSRIRAKLRAKSRT